MLLARNPSLHPGDVRIVRGVDVPALHHLKDVVVVPQTGDRPIVNMSSGGDLDRDEFLVIWDRANLVLVRPVARSTYGKPKSTIPSKKLKLWHPDISTHPHDDLRRSTNTSE